MSYAANSLYVVKTTNEDNNVSCEFADKLGRMLLHRQISSGINHDTYYVYDDMGNPRYVVSNISLSTPVVNTANYYDSHTFGTFTGSIPSTTFSTSTDADFNKNYYYSNGLLTGTLTAVMNGSSTPSNYLYSVFFYDSKGQIIQSVSSNNLDGTDTEYTAYTFFGKPAKSKKVHTAHNKPTQTEEYRYDYDHAERLVKTQYKLNNNVYVTLSKDEYDELSRQKTVTPYGLTAFRSSYAYSIRSWLTSIVSSHYNEHLTYDMGGNIETNKWQQDGQTRKYSNAYDFLSRLTSASFQISQWENLSSSYSYDKHGNLLSIYRYGRTNSGSYGIVDDLYMNYNSSN
jgi:hypothetical protein